MQIRIILLKTSMNTLITKNSREYSTITQKVVDYFFFLCFHNDKYIKVVELAFDFII